MTQHPISVDHANHALWWHGAGGYQPGSFSRALCAAFAAADPSNFERLRTAFGDLGEAMYLAGRVYDGIDVLRHIAAGRDVTYLILRGQGPTVAYTVHSRPGDAA